MVTLINNGRVITGGEVHEADVYINDGVIGALVARGPIGGTDCTGVDCDSGTAALPGSDHALNADRVLDASGLFVSAGFIDIHVHGGGGYDFMDGGVSPIVNAARLHLAHGTTTLYPTSVCAPPDQTLRFLEDVAQARQLTEAMPHIPGAHLEGPYLCKRQCGALNPDLIVPFDPAEYERLARKSCGLIKRWSFAPELPGADAFLRFAKANGIIPSIAHSDAVYADVERARGLGCNLMTHFYSGMSLLTREKGYRRLGVVESGYLLDDMIVEVICDGKHLPPELLRLIHKVKGTDRICLVTDAMRAAGTDAAGRISGLADGSSVIIEDGVAKTPDRESFAGSIATADRLVRTANKAMGVTLPEAVKMMTQTPARVMRLEKKGSIQSGFDADLVLFDQDINIKRVFVGGLEV